MCFFFSSHVIASRATGILSRGHFLEPEDAQNVVSLDPDPSLSLTVEYFCCTRDFFKSFTQTNVIFFIVRLRLTT